MGRRVVVTDADDRLLADFVALGDPATRRRVEREGGYFVVEGLVAIDRLLDLPEWRVRSFALLPRVAERLADRLAGVDAPIAVAEADVLRRVVGFDIHRGALASVERRSPRPAAELVAGGRLFVVAEGVNDHENLGALYRNAAAFGADAVLLDPTSADPFYRRSVRVSLGNVLAVPTGALGPVPAGLQQLQQAGVTVVALTPAGDVALRDLDPATVGPGPVAVLVGAEGPGLGRAALEAATHRVAIPMAAGVDSVNVATAAAIALHHLAR
ncbi:MAG: putative tRNA/rRNA methyltransferase [Acidimicrobiales bacterium]|nr:putative tRNA/rRNA methyltransferase [Acidimicrobiales bacterium]